MSIKKTQNETVNAQVNNAEQVINHLKEGQTREEFCEEPLQNSVPLPDLDDFKEEFQAREELIARRQKYDILENKFINSVNEESTESYDDQTNVLEESRITTKTVLKPVETLLSIGGVSVIERGDIYGIKGKPKSGKTSINKVLIRAALQGDCCCVKAEQPMLKVAYLDTEQKPADTQGILNYIRGTAKELTDEDIDENFMLYSLRKRDYSTLSKDLLRICVDSHPDIIIIDGIADLVRSFNDEEASKAIILLELRLVDEFGCAIINLIHENKGADDHNAKGHLGQLLTQKAAIMMEAKKVGNIIKVSCSESRHKSMPEWYLTYDENDMLCDATESYKNYIKVRTEKTNAEYMKVIKSIIEEVGEPINRTELSKKMAEKTKKSRPRMATIITALNGKGIYLVGNMVQTTQPEE